MANSAFGAALSSPPWRKWQQIGSLGKKNGRGNVSVMSQRCQHKEKTGFFTLHAPCHYGPLEGRSSCELVTQHTCYNPG